MGAAPTTSDQEYEYIWNAAETLGTNQITMELPRDDALLHALPIAPLSVNCASSSTHGQGSSSSFEKELAASDYTALKPGRGPLLWRQRTVSGSSD